MGSIDGLGEALALLADRRRISRTELASRLAIGKPTITKMLAPASMPNAKTLGRLLDALDCTVHDLAEALDEVNGRRSAYSSDIRRQAEEIAEAAGTPGQRDQVARLLTRMMDMLERITSPPSEKQ